MKTASVLSRMLHGFVSNNDLQGILPEAEFRRLLAYERALSDRHAGQFSLLIFSPATSCNSRQFNASVIERLKHRMRMTDVAGWVENNRVGALLPFSDHAGARVVAESVCAELNSRALKVQCELHTYPSDGDGGGHAAIADHDICDGDQRRLLALLTPPLPQYKRAVDIAVSLVALGLAAPLMLCIAGLIKLVSPGPAFFKQERVGHLGSQFTCWKFRTMTATADTGVHRDHLCKLVLADVPMTKLDQRQDPRVIPFGILLRASGLDELPQLYNVLRGDMSLVGPRPCIRYEYNNFQAWHRRRFDALPGLTGLWQVSGKNRTTFSQMMRLDVAYSRAPSLGRDLRIMWRTLPVLVGQVEEMLAPADGKQKQVEAPHPSSRQLASLEGLRPV